MFSSLPPRGLAAAESLEAQIGGLGWRRLARTNLVEKFLDKVKNPRRELKKKSPSILSRKYINRLDSVLTYLLVDCLSLGGYHVLASVLGGISLGVSAGENEKKRTNGVKFATMSEVKTNLRDFCQKQDKENKLKKKKGGVVFFSWTLRLVPCI